MRAVVQRVSQAEVRVGEEVVGKIGAGLLILLGVGQGDTAEDARLLVEKIAHLRIFSDAEGKFNLSAIETGAGLLVVSQFTLYADTRRGRRPGFTGAAPSEIAAPLVERFMEAGRALGLRVAGGRFGAHMAVELVNDGPVTIVLDSAEFKQPRSGSAGSQP
jgi:D-tyrosyl-tRNA(Tyr) deacylase